MLEIEGVTKAYRDTTAVDSLSLVLKPGVTGLLGPNGAGKTTLLNMLATIVRPTHGVIRWKGVDIAKEPNRLRSVLGYLPQDFGGYQNLTPLELLTYFSVIKAIPMKEAPHRIDNLLGLLNLSAVRHVRLGRLSGGNRQRVGIAQALLNDPELLIVDEPTIGLDPEERIGFSNILMDLSQKRTIVLSTHIVTDLEATASSIALMKSGRLVGHATPEYLISRVEGMVWEIPVELTDLPGIKAQFPMGRLTRGSDGIRIRVLSPVMPRAGRQASPTLEDAYLYSLSEAGEFSA